MGVEGPPDPRGWFDGIRGNAFLRSFLEHPSVLSKLLTVADTASELPSSLPPPAPERGAAGPRLVAASGPALDPAAYRDLFWSAPVPYVVTDPAGVIHEANAAARALLGVGQRDLAGSSLLSFVRIADQARTRAQVDRVAGGQALADCEVELEGPRTDPTVVSITLGARPERSGRRPALYWILHDITDRTRSEARTAYMAYHDRLTGLPNRALVEDFLALAIARARRSGSAVTLLCLDLDGFKAVNDRLGHAGGDDVLRQVGRRLVALSRGSDVVARFGGDEFMILLADRDQGGGGDDGPDRLADRIKEALEPPFPVGRTDVRVTASIGISSFPVDAANEADLMAAADAAMFGSKRARAATVDPRTVR
jgi:diguanylate cyclase (GGDEF)-like protein/PAS domain S-box-containing protein